MRYDRTVHLDTDFATTVSCVREALAEQGFGVLTRPKSAPSPAAEHLAT